jgi:hypothetical protein
MSALHPFLKSGMMPDSSPPSAIWIISRENAGGAPSKHPVEDKLVENVILEVRKNPRISLWSAKSAAVLRLLKKTKPEFSISKEASALIEDAVKDKYPDLWEVFEDREI